MKDVWRLAQEPGHPLTTLAGRKIGGYFLTPLIGPANRFGAESFKLFFAKPRGELSFEPVIWGLHHRGPSPSYHWMEVAQFNPLLSFPGAEGKPRLQGKLEENLWPSLFGALAELLPPGGHLMVEYESSVWNGTRQALFLGVPPVLTPLGYLLFQAGVGFHIKDWYFSEGGNEGPRKLQGFKPLDYPQARARAQILARQIEAYLSQERVADEGLHASARALARQLLAALKRMEE